MSVTTFEVKNMLIPVDHGRIEVEIFDPTLQPRSWMIMAHPHPLYGGSMHQSIVVQTCQIALEFGIGSVRFNFRGVGQSTGSFTGGIGEIQDLHHVVHHFRQEGFSFSLIGGYSFGAWVTYEWLERHPEYPAVWLGVAPPTRILPFEPPSTDRKRYVIFGQADPFIDLSQLNQTFVGSQVEIYSLSADHFFKQAIDDYTRLLREIFKKHMESAV